MWASLAMAAASIPILLTSIRGGPICRSPSPVEWCSFNVDGQGIGLIAAASPFRRWTPSPTTRPRSGDSDQSWAIYAARAAPHAALQDRLVSQGRGERRVTLNVANLGAQQRRDIAK